MNYKFFLGFAMMFFVVSFVSASVNFTDDCYKGSSKLSGSVVNDLIVINDCASSSYIIWREPVDLTILGDVVDDDVIIDSDWMFVDSLIRPDLDVNATLVFSGHSYAVNPIVYRDGVICPSSVCTDVRYRSGKVEVDVTGFSNYSLTGRQDFTVYLDYEPELDKKVYQTVDLGDRLSDYACMVQMFGQNNNKEWILVQTNPERAVQARILGNPDVNQPESLGYFPTKNGVANTYFRNHRIHGYNDFKLVIQCVSDSDKLVYEEAISTKYIPASRPLVSRGVWITDGDNAFYVMFWIVIGFFVLWIGGMIWRRTFS